MSDRTGRALGTLDPVIFFENEAGHVMLAPQEIGKGLEVARMLYEQRFKHQGYMWKEADTFDRVLKLEQRLIDQATKERAAQGERMDMAREAVRRQTSSDLRQRMASSDCDPWERDFIKLWMDLGETKRKEYVQRYTERNNFLWAVQMDSKTRVEDRMGE